MAKELLIVFVYDVEMCKREEDDPEEAIIYFYPTWVNREQRHALCSQLMGVTQFCNLAFSNPRIISLQSGKFSVKRLSRYFLCVGTDRNIPDIVLETRSKTLYRLLRLFHYDIESLHESLTEEDSEYSLTDKLTELFHVYMPILQYATNIFGNIPTFKLPKSASFLFLQAMHILQNLQRVPGVLGGVFLQQNKVIATQLSHQLTKQFVVTDPYRIKLPAEVVVTPFHLPVGVQLLSVYVNKSEIENLRKSVEKLKEAIKLIPKWRSEYDATMAKVESKKETVESGIKRSISTMFTVPEENVPMEEVPDVVKDAVKARHLARIQAIKVSEFVVSPAAAAPLKRTPATTDSVPTKMTTVPIRYYSLGLPKVEDDWTKETNQSEKSYYNTLTDPSHPYFRPNGLPCSSSLFQSCLSNHVSQLKATKNTKSRPKSILPPSDGEAVKEKKLDRPKRDFKLPLNTSSGGGSEGWGPKGGVALTPLMAKLSMLANEENVGLGTPLATPGLASKAIPSAKTPSRTATLKMSLPLEPCEEATEPTTTTHKPQSAKQASPVKDRSPPASKKPKNRRKFSDYEKDNLVPSVLFVYGQGNTVVLLLVDHTTAVDPDHIHYLWENCVRDLSDYEERLKGVVEAGVTTDSSQTDSTYSYLLVDPGWGPTDRAGAYRPHQIELLTDLHHSLNINPQITDIILRTEDTVSYGYQCVGRQVYYQESCSSIAGLPPPADCMGVVPVKARRRLDRDHNILIL